MLDLQRPVLGHCKGRLNSHGSRADCQVEGRRGKSSVRRIRTWSRDRDRRCNLTDKEKRAAGGIVAVRELPGGVYQPKTAEIVAAKGDPNEFLDSTVLARADATRLISWRRANSFGPACGDFLLVNRVLPDRTPKYRRRGPGDGRVEMVVLSPLRSAVRLHPLHRRCWDLRSGKAKPCRKAEVVFRWRTTTD